MIAFRVAWFSASGFSFSQRCIFLPRNMRKAWVVCTFAPFAGRTGLRGNFCPNTFPSSTLLRCAFNWIRILRPLA